MALSRLFVLTVVGLWLASAVDARALDPPDLQPPDAATGSPPSLVDRAEVEAHLDGLMSALMAEHDVAGATVAVVKDGTTLLSKGYGWADVARRQPVDPATTLFRIGSITKLFTWTAVMQLRDEGLLDLDVDVNRYLDFRIPDTYEAPITLRHLMTHTPGLEDRVFGLFGPSSGLPRGQWLRENLPARVRPPGMLPSYSNYGTALAGYIVERAAGLPWEQYVEDRILDPLGMGFATARQPLPDRLVRHMSIGYRYEKGRFSPKPFEWVEMAPAGSISASADAMAAFMIAHLQHGRHHDGRILAESTVREMHARAFAPDPRINALALGFYEKSSHGLRIVGHSGGTQWFFSDLAIVPSENLGLFVSFNSAGAASLLMSQFLDSFLDRYYPQPPPSEQPPAAGWESRARGYAGNYRFLRRSHTTFEKLLGALMEVTVEAGASGELVLRSPLLTTGLREVEPGYLSAPDRTAEVAFAADDRGRYTHLFLGVMPPIAAEKVGFWHQRGLHAVLLLFSVVLFVSVLVLSPVRYLLQRNLREIPPLRGPERRLRWVAVIFAALSLAFLLAVGFSVDQDSFMTGEAARALRMALVLPVLLLPLAVFALGGFVLAVRRRYWGPWMRLHYGLFVVAVIAFLLQLHYWNLLGWRL